ncbi:ABC transporter substrate-binding protein [Streptacidiphilus sp. EB129]|uniref:ABC transporter substrate-binding protein n=1 Tax=Streptacidiphilus sp. EB129 TaxID=3156262 RepID=UPI00351813CF
MRSTRKSGRIAAVAASAALLAASVSGCGGSATADDNGPIKVMTWAPQGGSAGSEAGMPALAEAIAKQVDATGGLQGHQLQVITCDEHNTVEGAITCASQAVAQHVVAVVGSYSQFAGDALPSLEAAQIPYIGGYGLSPEEFTSPYSYPVNGGFQTLLAGNGKQMLDSGCTRVAVIRPQSIVGDNMAGYLEAGLLGKQHVDVVDLPVTPGLTSYAPQAQQALGSDGDHNCVTTALDSASTQTFYDDYRRLNPVRTQLSSIIGSFQQSLVDSTGGDSGPLHDTIATGWYPADSSPLWKDLHSTIQQYAFTDNRISTTDPGVETTWIAYLVLRKAVAQINGPVTAGSLRSALENSTGIDTGGLTPPLAWQESNLLPLISAPRLVDTQVSFQRVHKGILTDVGWGLVDVRSILLH